MSTDPPIIRRSNQEIREMIAAIQKKIDTGSYADDENLDVFLMEEEIRKLRDALTGKPIKDNCLVWNWLVGAPRPFMEKIYLEKKDE